MDDIAAAAAILDAQPVPQRGRMLMWCGVMLQSWRLGPHRRARSVRGRKRALYEAWRPRV